MNFTSFQASSEEHLGAPGFAGLMGAILTLSMIVMPGFSFASGHLSSATLTPRRRRNLVQALATCLVFQLIFALMVLATQQHELPVKLWALNGVQWFLICLSLWRALLPLLTL